MPSLVRFDTCWLCQGTMRDSQEHILPKAITYDTSLRVPGFICRACNNRTGTDWDAWVTIACQPKFRTDSNYLSSLRESGPRRIPAEFITSDGEVIEGSVGSNGDFQETRKRPRETDMGNGFVTVSLQGAASDKKLFDQWEKVRDRFIDPVSEVVDTEYVHGITAYDIKISIVAIRKAIIKSYMALAYHVGIDPNVCDVSVPYLRGENADCMLQDPPIFVFREREVRYQHIILVYSMSNFLFGGAHISGSPLEQNGTSLDGELYVESFLPSLLSTRYNGPSIMKAYVVNVKEKEHEVLDIRRLLDNGTVKFNPRSA